MRKYTNTVVRSSSILDVLFLFLYIYPLYFKESPMSSRVLFALLGLVLLAFKRYFKLSFIAPFLGLIPMLFSSLIAGTINSTYDFFFIGYCVSAILIFFAAYFYASCCRSKFESSNKVIEHVIKLFIAIVTIQSVIALMMFLFPAVSDFLLSITSIPESEKITFENNQGFRVVGLGTYFFEAGVVHGLSLIAVVYLFLTKSLKHNGLLVVVYIFNFVVGVLMARTTLVGMIMSLFLLFIWKPLSIEQIKRKFKWVLLVFFVMYVAIMLVLMYMEQSVVKWAFEFFYNYSDYGTFYTDSTDRMKEMYVFPERFSTYLFGDGKYNLLSGDYYMTTDIGYLRLLYYGGLPMVFSYYFYSYYIIKRILKFNVSKLNKIFLYTIFMYLLVLNIKGLADLNPLLILIYVFVYLNCGSRQSTINTKNL